MSALIWNFNYLRGTPAEIRKISRPPVQNFLIGLLLSLDFDKNKWNIVICFADIWGSSGSADVSDTQTTKTQSKDFKIQELKIF